MANNTDEELRKIRQDEKLYKIRREAIEIAAENNAINALATMIIFCGASVWYTKSRVMGYIYKRKIPQHKTFLAGLLCTSSLGTTWKWTLKEREKQTKNAPKPHNRKK